MPARVIRFSPRLCCRSILVVSLCLGGVFFNPTGVASLSEDNPEHSKHIATTIPPLAWLVQKIAGQDYRTFALIPPGACLESFEPSLETLNKLSSAKIFVRAGSLIDDQFASRIDPILATNKTVVVVDAGKGVSFLPNDVHHWLSVSSLEIMASNILAGLIELDPNGAPGFRERYQQLLTDLGLLKVELQSIFKDCQGKSFLVFHPAWGYLARDYGLKQIPIEFEGKEPSAAQLLGVIKTAISLGIHTLFVQPGEIEANARMVAEEINGQTATIDPLAYDLPANLLQSARQIKAGLSAR